ncbi:MAG: tRNA1(Val) (adenine(37)-N6)-methyltransferase [Lachnospiraceae bacterium]|nr:tRNA1(Val) (adenine(37)-N6)-methyltransferase [Lachnospiraceae bacterium]
MNEGDILRNENERLDELLRNSYRIIQNTELFCFGMDAVLLSGFVRAKATDSLMDLCTGNGVIPILLAAKTDCPHMAGMEIQEESAALARRSVELNGLTDRIDIITGDIKNAPELFPKGTFSVVTVNPPYMNENSGLINPSSAKAIARHELLCTLEDVIRTAAYLLSPNGSFFMVHRPHRLPDIMDLMRKYRIEPKRMRLVYPSKEKEPNMILMEGAMGGNPFLRIEPPLIIYGEDGSYSEEVASIYANEEASGGKERTS